MQGTIKKAQPDTNVCLTAKITKIANNRKLSVRMFRRNKIFCLLCQTALTLVALFHSCTFMSLIWGVFNNNI
jgi:hypothetical protein